VCVQDLGADSLEILDELVECEIAILQPHLRTVVNFCLEVRDVVMKLTDLDGKFGCGMPFSM